MTTSAIVAAAGGVIVGFLLGLVPGAVIRWRTRRMWAQLGKALLRICSSVAKPPAPQLAPELQTHEGPGWPPCPVCEAVGPCSCGAPAPVIAGPRDFICAPCADSRQVLRQGGGPKIGPCVFCSTETAGVIVPPQVFPHVHVCSSKCEEPGEHAGPGPLRAEPGRSRDTGVPLAPPLFPGSKPG